MAHPNVDIVRDGYAAFSRGDLDTLQNHIFAPEIVWHFAGRSQLSGDFKGVADVMQWLGRNFELSDGTLVVDLHDVVGNDDHVVGLVKVSASRKGRQMIMPVTQVFHMHDGKVTEVWTVPEDVYASDEFWS